VVRYKELLQIFNDHLIDIGATARLFEEQALPLYSNYLSGCPYALGLFRICNSSAILTLNKIRETFELYGAELIKLKEFDDELFEKKECLRKRIIRMPINEFRNIYVAHPQDKKSKTPISFESAYKDYIIGIFGDTLDDYKSFYLGWLSPKTGEGVIHLLEQLREACRSLSKQ